MRGICSPGHLFLLPEHNSIHQWKVASGSVQPPCRVAPLEGAAVCIALPLPLLQNGLPWPDFGLGSPTRFEFSMQVLMPLEHHRWWWRAQRDTNPQGGPEGYTARAAPRTAPRGCWESSFGDRTAATLLPNLPLPRMKAIQYPGG